MEEYYIGTSKATPSGASAGTRRWVRNCCSSAMDQAAGTACGGCGETAITASSRSEPILCHPGSMMRISKAVLPAS